MTNDAMLFLVFGGFFAVPMVLAMGYAWAVRQRQLRQPPPVRRHWRRRTPTTLEELKWMAEYQRRSGRYLKWSWSGWAMAALALFGLGLPLTALALATLVPFAALIEHLRCPACDTTATLRGVTDGSLCRRCGARLKP
jgi:peptidoglycan/LPS O-acetylase OafA/YrhL